jgi:hypothetical protein
MIIKLFYNLLQMGNIRLCFAVAAKIASAPLGFQIDPHSGVKLLAP